METSTLDRLKTILNRYKLALRTLDEGGIEISKGHHIKHLRIYYSYLPFIIGGGILTLGYLSDFVLLIFCGIPFLVYAVYGLIQVSNAVKDNLNTTVIRTGEICISMNRTVNRLNSNQITHYGIKSECIADEIYQGQLVITDTENNEHILLLLIDDELPVLKENLDFLNHFIRTQMKTNHEKSILNDKT